MTCFVFVPGQPRVKHAARSRAANFATTCTAEQSEERIVPSDEEQNAPLGSVRYFGSSSVWGGNYRRHLTDPASAWRGGVFEYHSWRESAQARNFQSPWSQHGARRASAGAKARLETYCSVLGVAPTASLLEIRAAYRRAAFKHHPDRVRGSGAIAVANARFQRIVEAYEALSDLRRRQGDRDAYRSRAPQGTQADGADSSDASSDTNRRLSQDDRELFELD